MTELKSCPFCGGEMSLMYNSFDNEFLFYHKGGFWCPAAEPIRFDGSVVKSLKEATDAWNRRADNGE